MTREKPKKIELTVQEVEALVERIRQESLIKPDYGLLDAIVINYFTLEQVYQEQSHTLRRMAKQIFGPRTEKAAQSSSSTEASPNSSSPTETASPKGTAKGHGRNGASAYEGAQKVSFVL
jgi:transposase